MQPLKDTAVRAASKVRSKVKRSSHPNYSWLYPPDCEKDVEPVVTQWLQDQTNLEYVSRQIGKPFKSDPLENVVEYYAIVWTDRSGKLEEPFPGKHLVIIGLDYVDENNGLPVFKDTKSLDHGEYIVISGDDDMVMSDKGGGISLFVVLDMSTGSQ
ncbi:hypothetical protein ACJ73_05426 [Blastomyces percursus]|uniref:Uncharacterized protein n=1 Tax=Blastomyces percursus TaxID=1658174 RepID=A0A1J9Q3X6_9EURO|nr:hypothetical protein ACJ73_05426 [Blastomyces percursus]